MSMRGKTIVIAGGSSGMGLALARKLRGSRLHLIGRSEQKLLQLEQNKIARRPGCRLLGPIHLVRHLAPSMPKQGSLTFFSGAAAYTTRQSRALSPGVVDSPSWVFFMSNGFATGTVLQLDGGANA